MSFIYKGYTGANIENELDSKMTVKNRRENRSRSSFRQAAGDQRKYWSWHTR